ncbi:hypothetical protein PTTG_30087 [Puccinia triticina 1-1 BBBD Race 1]|uniref:Tc1-like transposase DDE domain-containing protein n=1 Tax=Puccinia triticina (isolate 1-1 / race 1 (BBBD)) TaxID=630390 RepID=A0A180G0J3_PUCT1|nr:hypothetical protein PTTG_30087 [Puccinia triticina 1-1 BBBD Race 1]
MSVSKAARAQRARRAHESSTKKKLVQSAKQGKKKTKIQKQSQLLRSPVIEIANEDEPISISDHNEPLAELEKNQNPADQVEIFKIFDQHVALIDEANQIMTWCNESDQSDSDGEDSDEVFKSLWPISFSHYTEPPKRKLASGRSGYLLPMANPNSESKKLVPRRLPKSTKHNYTARGTKAVGKKNNIMANFLKRAKDQLDTSMDEEEISLNSPVSSSNAPDPPVSSSTNNYLPNPPKKKPPYDERVLFAREFEELNNVIAFMKKEYRKREKTEKGFKYPGLELDELQEFNNLRNEHRLDGINKPAILASLTAASASNRRLQVGKKGFTTSVGRAKRLRHQASYVLKFKQLYTNSQGKGAEKKTLLDDPDIFKSLRNWAVEQKPGSVTPRSFHQHAVNVVLPRHGHQAISLNTATRWMYKLGFRAQQHQKSVYFDGHEREDVVESRIKFLDKVARLRRFSKKYDGDDCGTAVMVDPEILGDNKETVFIYHDESTIHAKEWPTLSWLLPGATELQSKSLGRLMHISDFILESHGRLVLSSDQQELNQLACSDAATVIYPGSQGDPWWDMAQLCKQVSEKALPIFKALHPDCQGVFVFDCSSAHEAYGPEALRAQNMNLGPGGKQSRMRDTIIPSDDPHIPEELRGQPQSMCFPMDYMVESLAGQPKGIQHVLMEHGLWGHYCCARIAARLPPLRMKCKSCSTSTAVKDAEARASNLVKQAEAQGYFIDQDACFREEIGTISATDVQAPKAKDCCWSQIMANQSDFLAKRPLLQTIIEEAGHICLFLPKFHCELNPIELFWAYVKSDYQRLSHKCSTWKQYQALFEISRRSCPLSTIRKFFRKIDRQHSAYALGLTGPAAQRAMKKYSSHRRIPKSALMDLAVINN